jgi:hypothetical protein
VYSLP